MNGTMMDYPLTLNHILERSGKLYGPVEIVSRLPDKSLHRHTYADFYRRARALAQALQQAGLERGDRVATLMWNHYAHLEAYFGVPAAGGVLHTLNLRLHPDDLVYIINHAGDRFLIVDDVLLPLYQKLQDRTHLRAIVVPLTGRPVPPGYLDYEAFLAGAQGDFRYPELAEDEAAGMCYTSGTTGKPKGVVYSHRAIVLHSFASVMADTLAISQRDRALPVVPMFHANAWGLPFSATMVGAAQVFPGPHLDPQSLLDLFQRERVTFTAGVPTVWLGILETLQKQPHAWDLVPGMRMAVGGAAAPESMIRGFDRFNLRVIHAWGMTETTPLGTVSHLKSYLAGLPEDEAYAVRATQGLPAPFVEVRAVDDAGAEVPWDARTMGELQVRGPWVAAEYYRQPDLLDNWTADGWFRTGDVVTIKPEGYVKIMDRTKDLVKSGGEWISSVDLENALMGHPAVREAAVIAVPHPRWQERPLAVVVLREGARATAEELREFLAPSFARWWLPEAFAFVTEIPRTSAGKFRKSALREQFPDWQWE